MSEWRKQSGLSRLQHQVRAARGRCSDAIFAHGADMRAITYRTDAVERPRKDGYTSRSWNWPDCSGMKRGAPVPMFDLD